MVPLVGVLPVMCVDQAAPGPGERCTYGAQGQTGLGRDLGVAEACVPQEKNLPVPRRQRAQGLLD